MGDTNVATVWEMYEAFGRGDVSGIVDRLADDVSWEDGRADDHGIPWLRSGRGKPFVASFFEGLQALEFKRFEPTAVLGGGETVVALIEVEAVVRDTGRTIADREVHVWTFGADGRVRTMRHVVDTLQHARALEL